MNARTSAIPRRAAGTRTYHVSVATRAIRAVLFGSAAALALSGAPAYAGTCTDAGTSPVLCDGEFTVPILFGGEPGGPVVDLTLVFGSLLPSSVTPAPGLFGISVTGSGVLDVTNFGSITTLDGDGIQLLGTGSAVFANHGTIVTQIDAAFGIQGVDINVSGDVRIVNSGTISATAISESYSAYALKAWATDGDLAFDNAEGGTITATAMGAAIGADVYAYFGGVTAVNHGTIDAFSDDATARGFVARSGDGTHASNVGTINVSSGGWGANVDGMFVKSHDDEVGTWAANSGDINVVATGAGSVAIGIYAQGLRNPGVTVFNDGVITVDSAASLAKGIQVSGNASDAYVRNDGTIDASGPVATGIDANSFRADLAIVNNGSIVTEGAGNGIWASSYEGDIALVNAGDIAMTDPTLGTMYGITGVSRNNLIEVLNSGTISLDGGRGFGVVVINADGVAGEAFEDTTFVNTGTVTVNTSLDPMSPVAAVYGGFAVGVYASSTGNTINIDNSGGISASAYSYSALAGVAQGISAVTTSGDVNIANSGSISSTLDSASAYGAGQSIGIKVLGGTAVVDVFNSGELSSSVLSSYYSDTAQVFSAGISSFVTSGETTLTNGVGGTITANAATSIHSTAAAVGIDAATLDGSIAVGNGGVIVADAVSGATDDIGYFGINAAVGIQVTNPFGLASSVVNATGATITATSHADFFGATSAFGIAVDASTGTVDVRNGGDIVATASALGHVDAGSAATAFGIQVIDSQSVATTFLNANGGAISADASAELLATATGVALGGLTIDVLSHGGIQASATANDPDGAAIATGVSLLGTDVSAFFGRNGDIGASATGASGTATGLLVSGSSVAVLNAGNISAQFDGAGGTAIGALLSTDGDLAFNNAGTVTATGDNATGVQLDSGSATVLSNTGTISAISTGVGSAAVRTGASTDLIWNSGTINGAVDTGAGNDTFGNVGSGLWHATGTSSFGAGDDSVANAGTLHLDGASIDLGTSTSLGNSFNNTGAILVSGDNVIDMGAANQQAFLNNGTIDFRNGVVGDTLHIVGNLGGSAVAPGNPRGLHAGIAFVTSSGSINFDVSGANGTSDLLYVDGNVVAGTYNTVNINLVDLPTTALTNIALIYVAGDSTSGSFRLGQVNYDPNGSFMTLAFNLVAQIDPTNATPDVFSLGAGAGHGGKPIRSTEDGGSRGTTLAGGSAPPTGTTRDQRDLARDNTAIDGKPRDGIGSVVDSTDSVADTRGNVDLATSTNVAVGAKTAPQPAGLEVTGLSDSGTMAASLAPGVQSLLSSEVGTWRQRLGVIDQFRKGSVALWTRLFQDSGEVSPEHTAGNFGQGGNFDFDQRNSGIEVGADFAVSDALSVGLLVAKADGRQSLQETGAGVSRIDGDTFGAYATWIADGFYLDASYRHMSFDARLSTSSGELRTSGDADAFSIEGGYAWTVGDGFKIEPQLQYTHISVDDIDSLQGTLATFHSTGGVLSRGRLGVMGRKSFATGSAVWTPYVSLNALREFDGDNSFNINGDFFGETSTGGTSGLVEAGLNVQAGKLSVFGGLNWQNGGAVDSIFSGQVGVRYGW